MVSMGGLNNVCVYIEAARQRPFPKGRQPIYGVLKKPAPALPARSLAREDGHYNLCEPRLRCSSNQASFHDDSYALSVVNVGFQHYRFEKHTGKQSGFY